MIPSFTAARATVRRGRVITLVALAGLAGVYLLALAYTPVELHQGPAQKIFYLHVPAAWTALLIFSLMGVVSIVYLWLHDERLDLFAEASAEVGLVFSAIMLTTGPIWAKPIWGTWWQWDPRLTLTLFLFFLYVGYMALRASIHDPLERGRFSAVVAILGMLLVPFSHLSVYLFRTLHPRPVVLKPSAPSLPPEMLRTLLIAFGVCLLLYVGLVMMRYGTGVAERLREAGGEAGEVPDAD